MIGEIIIGDDFLALTKYAFGGGADKNATVLVAEGVRWESAEAMAADFEVQRASLRPGLSKAVLHVALAWEPSETEKMTDKLMVTLAEEYLEGMGINPTKVQWSLIRHHDQPHPHAHLIVNRVAHEGEAIDCGNNFRRSNETCRELEQRYELVDAGERGEARTRALVERRALGEDGALRQKVLDAMDQHMGHCPTSGAELAEALRQEKVTMHPEVDEKGKMQAVLFTHDDHPGKWIKGSALRLEYGGEQLGETLARYAAFALDPPEVERDPNWSLERVVASRFMLRNLDYIPAAGVEEPDLASTAELADSTEQPGLLPGTWEVEPAGSEPAGWEPTLPAYREQLPNPPTQLASFTELDEEELDW